MTGGVHGNNRLGGNSLLECTVFGSIVGERLGKQIEAAKANNLPALMQTMATELANEAAPDPTTRQLAGLVLKNCVQAKSYMAQAALTQRWQQQTAELKGQIKQLVLTSLASPAPQARQTAPQVLAAIAIASDEGLLLAVAGEARQVALSAWRDLRPEQVVAAPRLEAVGHRRHHGCEARAREVTRRDQAKSCLCQKRCTSYFLMHHASLSVHWRCSPSQISATKL